MRICFFAIIYCFVFIIQCGVPHEEYEKLKAENEKLKVSLDDCENGSIKLLAKAKQAYELKDYEKCKIHLKELLQRHPESQEKKEGDVLLEQSIIKLEEIALEKQKTEELKVKELKRQEEKRIANEKRRLSNALANMRKKNDDMRDITWYYDKSSPYYINSRSSIHGYIGHSKESQPNLRFTIQYVSEDWLFVESYIINVDGIKYNISEIKYGEIKTDHGSGKIWEWLDISANRTEISIMKAIASGKDVRIRYIGKQYYKDRTVTNNEKKAMKNILNAYEALGGYL